MTELRWEDAAKTVTVTGWACVKCRRYWGDDERAARFCCSNTRPCEECGGRKATRLYCDPCAKRRDEARYAAAPRADWDGEKPLCLWDDDKFFWDASALIDYLEDEREGVDIADVRLEVCEPDNGRVFEMHEFLCDSLPEDSDACDFDEIDALVNKWIDDNAPYSWRGSGVIPTVESLRRHLRL